VRCANSLKSKKPPQASSPIDTLATTDHACHGVLIDKEGKRKKAKEVFIKKRKCFE
jgi:hypothetical protein